VFAPFITPQGWTCGQKDLAIASYEKSLTIRPDDTYAKAELEKLRAPAPAKP
jgi:predicted TPR repeat methyltransferase